MTTFLQFENSLFYLKNVVLILNLQNLYHDDFPEGTKHQKNYPLEDFHLHREKVLIILQEGIFSFIKYI